MRLRLSEQHCGQGRDCCFCAIGKQLLALGDQKIDGGGEEGRPCHGPGEAQQVIEVAPLPLVHAGQHGIEVLRGAAAGDAVHAAATQRPPPMGHQSCTALGDRRHDAGMKRPPEGGLCVSSGQGYAYFTLAMAVLTLRLVASRLGVWPWKSNASSTPGRNTRQWVEPPKWNMPS